MMIYTSIRKSKQKLRPKKEREEYQAWLEKHKPTKSLKPISDNWSYSLSVPKDRSTKHIPSLNTGIVGGGTLKPQKVYTGDKMLGIATLHKSNAVPVFNSEDAVDISKMRR